MAAQLADLPADVPSDLPGGLPADLDDAAILEATAAVDEDELDGTTRPSIESSTPSPAPAPEAESTVEVGKPAAVAGRPAADRGTGGAGATAETAAPPAPQIPLNGHGPNGHGVNGATPNGHEPDGLERSATAPQLRRFIKSRAYVPMHELRRRFAINGGEDDVTPIELDRQRIYVGLPPREGSLLGELLRAGDIGYELSMDPIAPIVVGVYPMRPVPRS